MTSVVNERMLNVHHKKLESCVKKSYLSVESKFTLSGFEIFKKEMNNSFKRKLNIR